MALCLRLLSAGARFEPLVPSPEANDTGRRCEALRHIHFVEAYYGKEISSSSACSSARRRTSQRPGSDYPHAATEASARGCGRCGARSRLCLGRGLPRMARRSICVGSRTLGAPAPARSHMGSAPLSAGARRMGLCSRTLALLITNGELRRRGLGARTAGGGSSSPAWA